MEANRYVISVLREVRISCEDALKRFRVPMSVALGATVLGALPMVIHGYLIVFRGSRLF